MSINVTRIILPGVGCFSRGHIAAFPVAPGEIYWFRRTEPQAQFDAPAIPNRAPRVFLSSAREPDVA